MSIKIKPLGNRVLVKILKQKTTTSSGIIIATEEKNEQAFGEIIAVGEGSGEKDNIKNLKLKVGDQVMFSRYGGEEFSDPDNTDVTYKILKGGDIIALIESN